MKKYLGKNLTIANIYILKDNSIIFKDNTILNKNVDIFNDKEVDLKENITEVIEDIRNNKRREEYYVKNEINSIYFAPFMFYNLDAIKRKLIKTDEYFSVVVESKITQKVKRK